MRALQIFAFLSVILISNVFAADTPPLWRGEDQTTYQLWEFNTDAYNPSVLDAVINEYGTPYASIVEPDPGPPPPPQTYWKDEDNGHTGVWRIYSDDYFEIYIPNNEVIDGHKEIWLQMVYYASGSSGAEPEFFTLPDYSSKELVSKTQLDDAYYYHGIWKITIEPNPANEYLWIQPRDCTLYIDQLTIDTICVPEPLSVLLLGLGGLALRKRKK